MTSVYNELFSVLKIFVSVVKKSLVLTLFITSPLIVIVYSYCDFYNGVELKYRLLFLTEDLRNIFLTDECLRNFDFLLLEFRLLMSNF